MALLKADIPPCLREEAERFFEAGWHRDMDGLVTDALRRYSDAHSEMLMEQFLEEDIAWGLRGRD